MKKKIAFYCLLGFVMAALCGCQKTSDQGKKDGSGKAKTVETSAEEVHYEDIDGELIYEELFDINNFVSIQLEISQDEMDKLQADYVKYDTKNSKSPIYRKVDRALITVDEEVYVIEEVGIRLKGNTSRKPVYDKETGELNLTHYKLSFNETFDDKEYYGEDAKVWESSALREERKNRRFATLKKMDVKWNKNYDETMIREYYAHEIYRQAGVPVQRLNVCSFGINQENYGVFHLYEPVDKVFIEKNFPEEARGGDLYKCTYTNRPANYIEKYVKYGIDDNETAKFFNYSLKTNEKSSTHAQLTSLVRALNRDDLSKEEYLTLFDEEELTSFMAASYLIGNPDDLRNNYNNHYLYFDRNSGKAIIIPFDNDRCLGITFGWNPDGTGMTAVSPYSDQAGGSGKTQENPIYRYGLLDQGYIRDKYTEKLKEFSAWDLWKEEQFEQIYELVKDNYGNIVSPTVKFANQKKEFRFSLEGTYEAAADANMTFEEYVTRIMKTLNDSMKN